MKKSILSLILVLVLLVSSVPMTASPVSAAVYNGECGAEGDNLTWEFDDESEILTIRGEGKMADYKAKNTPWYTYYSNIKTVIVEPGVTNIGTYAFYWCVNVEKAFIGNTVTSIGNNAFAFCIGLISIHVDSIENWLNISFGTTNSNPLDLGCMLYADGKPVQSLTIPESVTSISDYAFYKYAHLTDVTLHGGVVSIGKSAFYGCTALESAVLGKGLTTLGTNAFEGCTALTEIKITAGVKKLENATFAGCKNLSNVSLHDGVTEIGSSVFDGCASLKSITLPQGLSVIETYTFQNCTSLEFINIPEGPCEIKAHAFKGCKALAEIVIPQSVAGINHTAFNECDSLETVYYKGAKAEFESKIDYKDEVLPYVNIIGNYISEIGGDIDGDGDITTKDVLLLRKYLAGIVPELEGLSFLSADVDTDGELSTKDVLTVRKYLAGLITEF